MTLKIYPTLPGLTFPVLKTAEFDTLVTAAPNKYETGLPQTVNPLWSWELVYDFLRDNPGGAFTAGELRTLLDFFLYQGGQAGRFLFLDIDDNYVGPAMVSGAPNTPLAQLQLVDDGAGTYYSPLQRTMGGLFYEDITDLNTDTGAGGSALAVYANGTLATSGTAAGQYQLLGPGLGIAGKSFMGMYLKWGAGAPAWAASHTYALNAEILDAAGHIQKATGAAWAAATAYALNAEIIDPAGHVQKVTTAGTSGAAIPTFNDTGGTTADGTGTLVWTDQGSAGGNAGTSGSTAPVFSETGGSTPDGTGTLVWADQGYYAGPAAPITAQFNFYFRVKFESDSQDMEKFVSMFWTIGGSQSQKGSGQLRLMQARPIAL